jgi:glycosyltransferase involved in cell wall biosynthesis
MTQAKNRVLVISGVFPPARIAEADEALHTCDKLVGRGYHVEVLTTRGSGADVDRPFPVHAVMSKWDWSELPRLLRVAKQVAPDFIFLLFVGHAYHHHPMVTFAPTVLKRVLPGAAIVTQVTYPTGSKPWQHSIATRLVWKAIVSALGKGKVDYLYGSLLEDSDRVIVMAITHLKTLTRVSPQLPAKSILIPAPPLLPLSAAGAESRARGRQALGVGDHDFVFSYFGRLRRDKGLETLLKAFQILRTRQPKAKLAIVGGADEDRFLNGWRVDQLHELARNLGVDGEVIWTGEYPYWSDLGSAYLRATDVAMLPFDAGVDLNNSSFAAVAAHGLPTITTRGEGSEEPFRDGENVVLSPPLDPEAMAAAMERLFVDADLRQRLHSGIEILAKDWFSWDVSVNRTIDAFNTASHS